MIFTLEERAYYQDKYLLKVNIEELPFPNGTTGSYQVLPARLLGFDYPTYLRFCRDVLGAELTGRNHKYVMPVFEFTKEVDAFVKSLNAMAGLALSYTKDGGAGYEKVDGKVNKIEQSNI